MLEKINRKDSFALYFIKAVAILATIAAHVDFSPGAPGLAGVAIRAWDQFSCLAVGCFMICSGVVFHRETGDSRVFWKKKLKTTVLPWLFCAVLTYGYQILRGYGNGVRGLVLWTLGIGTWFYFVVVLLFFQVLFRYAARSVPVLVALVFVTPVHLVMRRLGLPLPLTQLLRSEYLDPLGWVGYFSLGILLRRRGLGLGKGLTWAAYAVFAASLCYMQIFGVMYQLHPVCYLFDCAGFVVLLKLGRWLYGKKGHGFFCWLGSRTFCIYLLHMQVVTTLARQISDPSLRGFIGPWVGLGAMMGLVWLGEWVSGKLPFGHWLRMLVGLK